MRGMPFKLQQGKGGLDVVVQGAVEASAALKERDAEVFWSSLSVGINKRKRGLVKDGLLEPRSVLDQRRSPSPPTSTSTLSSSLGVGAASSDTAGVAAISDTTTTTNNNNNPPSNKWPPSSDSTPSSAHPQASAVADERKEEWAAELQSIPAGLEMGLVGGEKCGGLGVEDWEAMLGESAASPGQERTFLGWIMGDIEDPNGLKQQQAQQQHLLLSQVPASDFDAVSAGLGFALVDPGGFGFGPLSGISGAAPPPGSASTVSPLPSSNLSSGGGFPSMAGNNGNTSRGVSSVQQSPSVGATTFPSMKVPSFGNNQAGSIPSVFPPAPANSLLSLPPGMFFNEPMEEKPQLFGPGGLLLNQQQQQSHHSPNPAFFLPLPPYSAPQPEHGLLPPQPKRHHTDPSCQISPKIPFSDSAAVGGVQDLFLRHNQAQAPPQLQSVPYHLQHRPMKPKAAGDEAAAVAAQQQQTLVDQLFKAAELVETGIFNGARGILARLNQQLPSPIGKPLLRSVFYFKEALHLLLNPSHSSSPQRTSPLSTPLDVVLKLSAYKAFSDLSPVVQFANFTCIQALLEELGNSDRIHIVDFDIGVGGQWSSFMQELAQRRCTTTPNPAPSYLKITAFVSTCSHHPLELHLTRENLSHFAADLNIPFEFNTLPLDSFDPAALLAVSAGADEAIAVNLPIGSVLSPPVPVLLRLVKQLSPKIVVSVDQGADRSDLPFSQHVIRALESSMVLLDSIDAAGALPDVTDKIERYLLQPRIEGIILGRHRAGEKVLSWRTLFTSLGFTPVQFSNFTETQAECLIKRVQVRGFHVEKHHASLILYWQRGELTSVSAWRS